MLTSRIPQLPFMRNVSGREANFPKGTERLFVGLEEMPVFSFRDTVAWAPAVTWICNHLQRIRAPGRS